MKSIFNLLIALYPSAFRAEFETEMRAVFMELAATTPPARFAQVEIPALFAGAAREHWRYALKFDVQAISMAFGAIAAFWVHLALYALLVPVKGHGLGRLLSLFSLALCVVIAQPIVKQDPETLRIANAIYAKSFKSLREAKTVADLVKLSELLEAADWISVDRFGRTVLTKQSALKELESLLTLPPEQRVTAMDIVWAEKEGDRMTVLAWMMPYETERADTSGDYGAKGVTRKLWRGTLVRDVFAGSGNNWLRIRHDKLLPNGSVLAVDGVPRILPPLTGDNHVVPAK